jgi:hypothetical protein
MKENGAGKMENLGNMKIGSPTLNQTIKMFIVEVKIVPRLSFLLLD